MSTLQPLLIELGTEELPVKALPGLAQAFFDNVIAALDKRGIAVERGDAQPLYTPRRIAVLLPGVASQQPEQTSEVLGPYRNIALDAAGNPTKALEGFAAKAGVAWTALQTVTDGKGERFVHRAVTPGAATRDLLGDVVRETVAALPIPKPMRWGAHPHAFVRPLHWLVMLLGDEVAPGEVFGISAGRESRGHRFLHPQTVAIASPSTYVQQLHDAKVLVDVSARRDAIVAQVNAAATSVGGQASIDAGNLDEVVCLTEWPHAVLCGFERDFLAVPSEALVSTMQANQKFFAIHDADGALTEHFVGVANIAPNDVTEIRKGYERVIRPRFADAKFFFDEDRKQGLRAMGDGLASVTYQAKLGSVADKVQRVAALAEAVAQQVGVDPALARRAALLAKNDLQSRMVGEFPELQGIAGRHYALAAGESADVAAAIDEAYMPRFAADAIAPSPLGQVLAIAERLDTLAGGFAAGLKPTGNKDPFALRRNALGLARTLLEGDLDLDLFSSLDQATDRVAFAKTIDAERKKADSAQHARDVGVIVAGTEPTVGGTSLEDIHEIYDFILERLRGYYADQKFTPQQFDAVAALRPTSLTDFDARLKAIGAFAASPDATALAAANKRIRNILRKAEGEVPRTVDPALFVEDAERALADALHAATVVTDPLLERRDYVAALTRLAQLRAPVDAFFDGVMVNADDPAVRRNRLALLQTLADRLGSVAAIEHLSG